MTTSRSICDICFHLAGMSARERELEEEGAATVVADRLGMRERTVRNIVSADVGVCLLCLMQRWNFGRDEGRRVEKTIFV